MSGVGLIPLCPRAYAGDEQTIEFFKIVQNKLLWAISQQTAAELRRTVQYPLLYKR